MVLDYFESWHNDLLQQHTDIRRLIKVAGHAYQQWGSTKNTQLATIS